MSDLRERMLAAASEVEGQWPSPTQLRTLGARRRTRRRVAGLGGVAGVAVLAVALAALAQHPGVRVEPAAPPAPCPVSLADPTSAASDAPAVEVTRGRLAFVGATDVWVTAAGKAPVRVASTSGDPESTGRLGLGGDPVLAWSPGGGELVMTTRVGGRDDPLACGTVVLANTDGSGVRVLSHTTLGSIPISPAFSPDGQSIAYVVKHLGGSSGSGAPATAAATAHASVVVTNLHGGDQEFALDCFPYDSGAPIWSPDGTRLALSCDDAAAVVSLPQGNVTQAKVPAGRMIAALGWRPDGVLLAALPEAGPSQNDMVIATYDPETTQWTQVSHPALDVEWGVPFPLGFSPSGNVLLATGSQIGGSAEDYTEHYYPIDVASGSVDVHSALSQHLGWTLGGWAAHSDDLVVTDPGGRQSQVFLVAPDGGSLRSVATAPPSLRDDFPGYFVWREQ